MVVSVSVLLVVCVRTLCLLPLVCVSVVALLTVIFCGVPSQVLPFANTCRMSACPGPSSSSGVPVKGPLVKAVPEGIQKSLPVQAVPTRVRHDCPPCAPAGSTLAAQVGNAGSTAATGCLQQFMDPNARTEPPAGFSCEAMRRMRRRRRSRNSMEQLKKKKALVLAESVSFRTDGVQIRTQMYSQEQQQLVISKVDRKNKLWQKAITQQQQEKGNLGGRRQAPEEATKTATTLLGRALRCEQKVLVTPEGGISGVGH